MSIQPAPHPPPTPPTPAVTPPAVPVEPVAPEVTPAPEPEATFTRAQVLELVEKGGKLAVEAYAKANPPVPVEPEPAPEPPATPEPPPQTPESLVLAQQLEAEKAKNAELQTGMDDAAAAALKSATIGKIYELIAKDPNALKDADARRSMAAELYETKAYTFTDGALSHTDITAQPGQIVTDFLAARKWYQEALPTTGPTPARPGVPGAIPPNNQSDKWMPTGDKHADLLSAAEWDRTHKG